MPRSKRENRKVKKNDDAGADVDVDILSDTHTIDSSQTMTSLSSIDLDFENYLGEADQTLEEPESTTSSKHLKTLHEIINLSSDITFEKRSSKRELLLKLLFKSLSQHCYIPEGYELVQSSYETIVSSCLYVIDRNSSSSPAEQYAACRILEVTSICLGSHNDDYCELIDGSLLKVVKATGRSAKVRCAALRAKCCAAFVCGSDESHTQSLLDLCEAVVKNIKFRGEVVPAIFRATALECWALLGTTIPADSIAADDCNYVGCTSSRVTMLNVLKQCLDSKSMTSVDDGRGCDGASLMNLRNTAAMCVVIIHEARLSLGLNEDECDHELNITERRFHQGTWEGSDWEEVIDEVTQRISDLSVESSHRISKKAKKQQRSQFREYASMLLENEFPSETIQFRGSSSISLNSWMDIIPLNFLRHCLQGGFQIQLMMNPTLHNVFDVNGSTLSNSSGANLSQLEKRLFMSKTSDAAKKADRDMNRNRRNRMNAKHHFITADCD